MLVRYVCHCRPWTENPKLEIRMQIGGLLSLEEECTFVDSFSALRKYLPDSVAYWTSFILSIKLQTSLQVVSSLYKFIFFGSLLVWLIHMMLVSSAYKYRIAIFIFWDTYELSIQPGRNIFTLWNCQTHLQKPMDLNAIDQLIARQFNSDEIGILFGCKRTEFKFRYFFNSQCYSAMK